MFLVLFLYRLSGVVEGGVNDQLSYLLVLQSSAFVV